MSTLIEYSSFSLSILIVSYCHLARINRTSFHPNSFEPLNIRFFLLWGLKGHSVLVQEGCWMWKSSPSRNFSKFLSNEYAFMSCLKVSWLGFLSPHDSDRPANSNNWHEDESSLSTSFALDFQLHVWLGGLYFDIPFSLQKIHPQYPSHALLSFLTF